MKTKLIILIASAAIVTLSFSFASANRSAQKVENAAPSQSVDHEPIGGFLSEDKE